MVSRGPAPRREAAGNPRRARVLVSPAASHCCPSSRPFSPSSPCSMPPPHAPAQVFTYHHIARLSATAPHWVIIPSFDHTAHLPEQRLVPGPSLLGREREGGRERAGRLSGPYARHRYKYGKANTARSHWCSGCLRFPRLLTRARPPARPRPLPPAPCPHRAVRAAQSVPRHPGRGPHHAGATAAAGLLLQASACACVARVPSVSLAPCTCTSSASSGYHCALALFLCSNVLMTVHLFPPLPACLPRPSLDNPACLRLPLPPPPRPPPIAPSGLWSCCWSCWTRAWPIRPWARRHWTAAHRRPTGACPCR